MIPTVVSTTDLSATISALISHALRPTSPLAVVSNLSNGRVVRRLHTTSPHHNGIRSGQYHPLIVPTSGSTTDAPHLVCLGEDALRASADAAHERLNGPGQWITVLPLDHIAGIQTVIRSVLSGHEPIVALRDHFSPAHLAATIEEARTHLPSSPLYTSLVSAQLVRCLEADPLIARSLASLDAIVVGGGFIAATLVDRAREAGITLVRSYGMTETCGGCVYDSLPLEGVNIRTGEDGRILLSGPLLMDDYLDEDAQWVEEDGHRWFVTSDLGSVAPDGRLSLKGRADDLIKSAGEKVNLSAVAHAAEEVAGVRRAYACAVEDERWGHMVTLVAEQTEGATWENQDFLAASLRETVASRLGQAAAPRLIAVVDQLPVTSLGKVNRSQTRALVEAMIRQGNVWQR